MTRRNVSIAQYYGNVEGNCCATGTEQDAGYPDRCALRSSGPVCSQRACLAVVSVFGVVGAGVLDVGEKPGLSCGNGPSGAATGHTVGGARLFPLIL